MDNDRYAPGFEVWGRAGKGIWGTDITPLRTRGSAPGVEVRGKASETCREFVFTD